MQPILSGFSLPCRAFIPAHDVRFERGDLACHGGISESVAGDEHPRRDFLRVWEDTRRKERISC